MSCQGAQWPKQFHNISKIRNGHIPCLWLAMTKRDQDPASKDGGEKIIKLMAVQLILYLTFHI